MPAPPFEVGDVLFTQSTSGFMRKVIAVAQTIGSIGRGGTAKSVHAAIVIALGQNGEPIIAESVGSGLRSRQAAAGNYRVYRYTANQDVAEAAAQCAEGCVAIKQSGAGGADYGAYAKLAAGQSPFNLSGGSRLTADKSLFAHQATTFFCSNFVYKAFASAAELMALPTVPIANGRSQVGPRDLMVAMDGDPRWTFQGLVNI